MGMVHGSGSMRPVALVSAAGFTSFGAFYGLYTAAPVVLGTGSAAGEPSGGLRIGVFMAVVILVQPFVPIAGRYLRVRARVVAGAMAAMSAGFALLPLGGAWAGLVLTGAGFGVFVVTAAAWARELAPTGRVGRALGLFGFASAVGGTLGAPAALALADRGGITAVAAGGAVLVGIGILPVLALRARHAHPMPETGPPGAARMDLPPITDVDITRSEPHEPLVPGATAVGAGEDGGSDAAGRSHRGGRPDGVDPGDSSHADGGPDDVGPGAVLPHPRPSRVTAFAAVLAAHVLAVLAYGLVLSSAGAMSGPTAGLGVGAALAVQAAVALGRPTAGWSSDRWSASRVAAVAVVGVAVSLAAAAIVQGAAGVLVAATLIGFTSGAVQAAALTLMMQLAHTAAGYERASTAWNMSFDVALAVAAVLAARLPLF